MQKLLSGIGILGLAVWTVGGAAAWYAVKEKVQITISEAPIAGNRRVDRVSLVEEAVAGLRQDVQALARALETNLPALAAELDRCAGKRADELERTLRGIAQRLAERDAALEKLATASRDHRAALETLLARGEKAAPGPVVMPTAVHAEPDPPTTPVAKRTKADPPEKGRQDRNPIAVPAQRETAVRRFLSFRLPSAAFAFDNNQSFEIIPSLSRVGFDAKSTLHDFSGVTSKIEGRFSSNLAAPAGSTKGRITVAAGSLDTGLASRNEAMHDDHLDVKAHPDIVFELEDLRAATSAASTMTVSGTAVGKLMLHGVTRAVEMPVRAKVDESRRLFVEGETALKLSDYEIQAPSKLGLISMEDEVRIWISLRARLGVGR